MKKQWKILHPDIQAVEKIRKTLECDPVTARVMVNRNILSEKDASLFLNASLGDLRPPFSMKDMDVAVNRICSAITKNEKIMIFGDYDADGVTATTILFEFLQYAKADVSFYIPHRVKEGYSLQVSHISDYAIPAEIKLIITVDCGSSSHDAVRLAQKSGIDVIVTDHHAISHDPPPALAVAFYLMVCLRKHLREIGFWKENLPEPNLKNFCDLVAIGTVADIVPLTLENRIFSKTGLDIINTHSRIGVSALMDASGIGDNEADTETIAFRLAPRLNAAGRLDHARIAVELLTTRDPESAKEIARNLHNLNALRQEQEQKIFEQILVHLNNHPHLLNRSTLVLAGKGWHEGVIGIVASRVVERFFRPVILIATNNGMGKGSGRSIPGIDLHAGILSCEKYLEYFGGHAMAAGLTIKANNIGVFQQHFEDFVKKMSRPEHFVPTVSVDTELEFDDISDKLTDELESLQPFGEGNPEPLFMAKNIKVSSSKIVGKNHRRMILRQNSGSKSGKVFNAMHFNIDPEIPLKENYDQIIFRLKWNRWNGKKIAQLIIEDM